MLKRLLLVLAVLGLFLAAMPTRADAQCFIRGHIYNTNDNPFTLDSAYVYHIPDRTICFMFGLGGHAHEIDSFDFRFYGWPTPCIKEWFSRSDIPQALLDSFEPIAGVWHTWHYPPTWESLMVMYDSIRRAGVDESKSRSAPSLMLSGAAPNPFRAATTIRFSLPAGTDAELTILNPAGVRVRMLSKGRLAAGTHDVVWNALDDDGRPVESGVYFCRLSSPGLVTTGKLILNP